MEDNKEVKKENKYWMSLDQWREDPEFQEVVDREFVTSPFAPEDSQSGWARREFLKLMGASMALTSFGCVRKAQKIVPYVKRPEEVIPGVANFYASSYLDGNEAFGTVVKTREGRPIKVEGNPEHPLNKGSLSARAHAHILSLYDPDRADGPKKNLLNEEKSNRDTINISWEKLDKEVVKEFKKGRVGLLTSSVASPSLKRAIGQFKSSFSATHYVSDTNNSSLRDGQRASFGSVSSPRYRFDKANYILSFAADFLGTYMSPTEFTKQFSSRRQPGDDMNKLVVVESLLSLTGTNADNRYRVRPSQLVDAVMGVAYHLVTQKGSGVFAPGSSRKVLERFKMAGKSTGLSDEVLKSIASDLAKNKGKSIVIAGGLSAETESALELQIAVNYLNSILGNHGRTIDLSNVTLKTHRGSFADLNQLVKDLNSGKVKRLIINGVNPVYSTSKDLKFVEALKKAETVVYVGDRNNETARYANILATESHPMESWGDLEPQDGVYSIQQPTIRPLYSTRSFGESLLAWMRAGGRSVSDSWYDYVRSHWRNSIHASNRSGMGAKSFDSFWVELLQEGVFDTTKSKRNRASGKTFRASALNSITPNESKSQYELSLYETVGLRDGSLANVSWLQEFPDPVTRICWDNYITVSPHTAHELHLKEGQILTVDAEGEKVSAPVHIQPGQEDSTLGLAVGYGRTAAGKVANMVGANAYALAKVKGSKVVYSGIPATVKKEDRKTKLASVQDHHSMEGRQIVVEATLEQFKKKASAGIHKHKVFSAWPEMEYKGHKWGMSVDLNSCTGCGSCVIACQSENNIPVVGKKYILQGREMSWIRIDRYYVGDPKDPDTVYQPVMCMHCDNAPCETVCPVAATVHSDEGTNDMIYNRCVGTRYCANNCPYKVRRFNWFNYTKVESPLQMAMNPEVSVRSRGVMEKCTFCNHKIKEAKQIAKTSKKEFKATSVKTACQESCPANAITFGDMNDPSSEVSKAFKDGRNYSLLEELMTKPAVQYKTKIRNTAELKGGHGKGGHH